jgi:transcriptional regulator with XRE-family HTH domain
MAAMHPKRAGQRLIPDATRRRAFELHAAGYTPKQVAEALGVNRGTVRSWLSRGRRPIVRQPASRDELEAMAGRVETGLAGVREALAADDPRALLKAAHALGPTVDAMILADGGPVPPELAARLTVDPWSGDPVHRVEIADRPYDPARDAARRRTMGRAIGVRASTLIRWEAGQVRPPKDTALAWLAVLDQLRAELDQDGPD